jgi:oligopeptide/dipeptide ABC transporter ATP-binding protein
MYAGRVVEVADVCTLFEHPAHPYTQGLIKAVPRTDGDEFPAGIGGDVSSTGAPHEACAFAGRCSRAMPVCTQRRPPAYLLAGGQTAYCFLHESPHAT